MFPFFLGIAPGDPSLRFELLSDILVELDILVQKEPDIASQAAIGAYFNELGKLRRELINDHPQKKEARKKIEEVINRGFKKMEVVNV